MSQDYQGDEDRYCPGTEAKGYCGVVARTVYRCDECWHAMTQDEREEAQRTGSFMLKYPKPQVVADDGVQRLRPVELPLSLGDPCSCGWPYGPCAACTVDVTP